MRRVSATLRFVLPAGYGAGRALVLMVGGVPSSVFSFIYDAPVITNVSPDRLNVAPGFLRLYVEGVNFCASPFVPSAGGWLSPGRLV